MALLLVALVSLRLSLNKMACQAVAWVVVLGARLQDRSRPTSSKVVLAEARCHSKFQTKVLRISSKAVHRMDHHLPSQGLEVVLSCKAVLEEAPSVNRALVSKDPGLASEAVLEVALVLDLVAFAAASTVLRKVLSPASTPMASRGTFLLNLVTSSCMSPQPSSKVLR